VHYRLFKHWGFERMAKKEHDESIGEMKHADRLMDRILMQGGLPNLQDLGKLMIGETLPEALACDLKLEQASQVTISDGIGVCETARDYVLGTRPRSFFRSRCCKASWTTPKSTSTSWKPRSS
jgi:bacterioferritin